MRDRGLQVLKSHFFGGERNIPEIVLTVFFAVIFCICLFSITIHIQSALVGMIVSALIVIATARWRHFRAWYSKIRRQRTGRIVTNTIAILALVVGLYAVVIFGFMLNAVYTPPSDDATLIVLGCQVRGETPSLMLQKRMETALEYLRKNPKAVAVLSGGQGPDEFITEAEAMRRFLVDKHISENRLFMEENSTSTYENIVFSHEIIESNNQSQNIAIVTDGFHQFRAQSFAKSAGLSPGAVASGTPFYLLPYYWVREAAAITTQIVF